MSNVQAMTITSHDVPKGRLGMWLLIAGEIVIFGGLITAYVLCRLRYPEFGVQAANTSTPLGALNTFILLSSSFTAVLAHAASLKKDYSKITLWFSLTILGAVGFLVVKAIEYTTEIHHGFTFSSPALAAKGENIGTLFWSFYYFMTGFHALHVIVGAMVIFFVMLSARKGKNVHRVEYAGMYWHFVDIVWIFLFPLLYIAK